MVAGEDGHRGRFGQWRWRDAGDRGQADADPFETPERSRGLGQAPVVNGRIGGGPVIERGKGGDGPLERTCVGQALLRTR